MPKEERRLRFCIGAKVCSKGMSEQEARQVCLTALPKPPSVGGRRKKTCSVETMDVVSTCMETKLKAADLTGPGIKTILEEALSACLCGKKVKMTSEQKVQKMLDKLTPEQLEALDQMRNLAHAMGTTGGLAGKFAAKQ